MVLLGKNRDRLSLVAAILEAAGAGSSKTRVMKVANLSYKLLDKYLAAALSLGFVERSGAKYSLTERGRDFLKRYKQLQDQYLRVEQEFSLLINRREVLERMCMQNEFAKSCLYNGQVDPDAARTPDAME